MNPSLKRKYLTQNEIIQLMKASRNGRYPERDECLIYLCFTHGLRVSEVCHLRVSDINLADGVIHVRRLKNGLTTSQPLLPNEISLLEKWLSIRKEWRGEELYNLFLSQKGRSLSRQQIYNILRKYGLAAGISIPLHPHMLRHSCGFALANTGADTRLIQDYLGHRNIHHTVLYTASNHARFLGIWNSSFIIEE
ncbi:MULTISPECIES: tyrosine-type DNA invertase [Serratia]|jgi:type 1 fimbriae regulatory protein FimB|uniref:tyrosine-type DNA invertase n=1 Tax=Serratia TaxID=613 RepID=UPI001AE188FF|nr:MULTISPECIES: tyrosine-type DNA invertase [Serratia]MBP1132307.1 type 1 fimbriae regulatory protein FimB [Serratia sp. PL17]